MERRFSIFRVYDYKGGELSSRINKTEEDLILELSEYFQKTISDLYHYKKISTLDECVLSIEKSLQDEDFYNTYAGGGGFCGKVFEHKNNLLVEVKIETFIYKIAKCIFEMVDN